MEQRDRSSVRTLRTRRDRLLLLLLLLALLGDRQLLPAPGDRDANLLLSLLPTPDECSLDDLVDLEEDDVLVRREEAVLDRLCLGVARLTESVASANRRLLCRRLEEEEDSPCSSRRRRLVDRRLLVVVPEEEAKPLSSDRMLLDRLRDDEVEGSPSSTRRLVDRLREEEDKPPNSRSPSSINRLVDRRRLEEDRVGCCCCCSPSLSDSNLRLLPRRPSMVLRRLVPPPATMALDRRLLFPPPLWRLLDRPRRELVLAWLRLRLMV